MKKIHVTRHHHLLHLFFELFFLTAISACSPSFYLIEGLGTKRKKTGRPNSVPTATLHSFSVSEDSTYEGNGSTRAKLSGQDADQDVLSCKKVTGALHGTVVVRNDCSFFYAPEANFSGNDFFSFAVSDGEVSSAPAPVEIKVDAVNDAPIALNLSFSTPENTSYVATGNPNPKLPGSDIEHDAFTCNKASDPTNGRVEVNPDCSFTYTPNPNFKGDDSFTFSVKDENETSAPARVGITVGPTNRPPIASPATINPLEDSIYNGDGQDGRVKLSVNDPDGDALSCSKVGDASKGAVTVNPNCTFTYKANANYNGPDSFTFRVSDGLTDSAPATVTINVVAVNDVPVANDREIQTPEDTPYAGFGSVGFEKLSGSDIENDYLKCASVTNPSHGTVVVNLGCSFIYTPEANYNGPDSFTFTVNDGTATSAPATVSITVTAVNDAPSAPEARDRLITPEDTPYSGTLSVSDIEGDSFTCAQATGPTHGSVTVNANCSFTYTPNLNYNGPDAFTFSANDGTATSAPATVSITVTPVNDPPSASELSFSVDEEDMYLSDGNTKPHLPVQDIDADLLTCSLDQDASNGDVVVNNDCSFSYLPDEEFSGSDSFTFKVSDGLLSSNSATVSITVNPLPDRAPRFALSCSNYYSKPSRKGFTSNCNAFAAKKSDGTVVTWGDSTAGGDSSTVAAQLVNVKKTYSTASAFAALKLDGSVVTWGNYGGNSSAVLAPLTNIVRIYSNQRAFAALTQSDSVITWGESAAGGDGSPIQTDVKRVFSSYRAFAALKNDNTVVTWGGSSYGANSSSVATALTNILAIQPTNSAFAALKTDASVITWGNTNNGGLSNPADLHNIVKVTSTEKAFAALKSITPGNNTVVTWGEPTLGGNSSAVAAQLTNVVKVFANKGAFAALKGDGTVVTWGDPTMGGNSSAVATQLTNVTTIVSSDTAFAALKNDYSVVTWGDPNGGGDSSAVSSPLVNIKRIYSTKSAFAAIKFDNTVVSWGDSANGGDSSAVKSQLNGVKRISSTGGAFAAIKSDFSVVTWGSPTLGGDSSGVNWAVAQ